MQVLLEKMNAYLVKTFYVQYRVTIKIVSIVKANWPAMYNEAKCGTSSRRMFGVGSDHSQNTYSNRECCDNFKHNMEILNRRFNRRNCKDSGKNVPTITPTTCPPTTFLGVAATLSGTITTIHETRYTRSKQQPPRWLLLAQRPAVIASKTTQASQERTGTNND